MVGNMGFPSGIDHGVFGMKGSHVSIVIIVLLILYGILCEYCITYLAYMEKKYMFSLVF